MVENKTLEQLIEEQSPILMEKEEDRQHIVEAVRQWLDQHRNRWISDDSMVDMLNYLIIRDGVLEEYKELFKELDSVVVVKK